MPRRTPAPESEQSIPEMVDELTRQEIATWYKNGKLTPHGRQMGGIGVRSRSSRQRMFTTAPVFWRISDGSASVHTSCGAGPLLATS